MASVIERRTVSWAIGQRIPLAENVALAGDGGTGKSTFAQELAARVSRGQLGGLPGGSDLSEPRGVVICTTEEDPEAVVNPRLTAMGADLDRILILSDYGDGEAPPLTLPSGAPELAYAARYVNAALIVIDTGPSFLDPGLKSNAEEDVRQFYRPLAAMAREMRLTRLTCCHLNKGSEVARYRVAGSAAWVNVPRSAIIMGAPAGDDPLETSERLLVVVKANLIAGKLPDAIAMRLTPAREDPTVGVIAWTGEQAGVRASDLTTNLSADEKGERDDCAAAILELLRNGPQPARECEDALKKAGHAKRTIRRARESLFVTRQSKNVYQDVFHGPWLWRLPTDARARVVQPVDTSEEGVAPSGPQVSNTHTDVHKLASRERTSEPRDDIEDWRDMVPDVGGAS